MAAAPRISAGRWIKKLAAIVFPYCPLAIFQERRKDLSGNFRVMPKAAVLAAGQAVERRNQSVPSRATSTAEMLLL